MGKKKKEVGTMKKKVYILHGWAYSTEKWKPFLIDLKEKGFEPVMLKIPGLTAPLNEVWTIENYVEWLRAKIGSQKNIILLGHSNGGRIAIAFVAKYPSVASQLILIDSAGIYHNGLRIRIKRLFFGSIAKLGKIFFNSEKIRKLLYKFAREHDYEKADPIVRQTMVNLIRTDLSRTLKQVSTQTLIIWGEEDRVTPVVDAKLMSREIVNSQLRIIAKARHSPMFTHPNQVVEIIRENL